MGDDVPSRFLHSESLDDLQPATPDADGDGRCHGVDRRAMQTIAQSREHLRVLWIGVASAREAIAQSHASLAASRREMREATERELCCPFPGPHDR